MTLLYGRERHGLIAHLMTAVAQELDFAVGHVGVADLVLVALFRDPLSVRHGNARGDSWGLQALVPLPRSDGPLFCYHYFVDIVTSGAVEAESTIYQFRDNHVD